MPNPKRRHSKSRTRQRRAHDALKTPQFYIDKDTGEEMPKFNLSARIDRQVSAYITDDSGNAHIEYPAGVKYISVSAKRPGLVGVTFTWNSSGKKDKLPDNVKFEMVARTPKDRTQARTRRSEPALVEEYGDDGL